MIRKMCNRCGKYIPVGTKCTCQTLYNKDYNRFRRDKRIQKFRSSPEWFNTRDEVINRDGGIDLYLYNTTGEIKAGNSVHHIIPLSEDFERRLDTSNLITLSDETHGRIEYLYKTGQRRKLQEELLEMVSRQTAQNHEGI